MMSGKAGFQGWVVGSRFVSDKFDPKVMRLWHRRRMLRCIAVKNWFRFLTRPFRTAPACQMLLKTALHVALYLRIVLNPVICLSQGRGRSSEAVLSPNIPEPRSTTLKHVSFAFSTVFAFLKTVGVQNTQSWLGVRHP